MMGRSTGARLENATLRADVIGSLCGPFYLLNAKRAFGEGRIAREELEARLSTRELEAVHSKPSAAVRLAARAALAAAMGVSVDAVDWGHTMSPRNVRYHRFGLPDR